MELRTYLAHLIARFLERDERLREAPLLMLTLLCTVSASAASAVSATPLPHPMLRVTSSLHFAHTAAFSLEARGVPSFQPTLRKGTLLVASRYLADPNFAKTVVLLVDYGAPGAMGLIINRPTRLSLAEVFPAVAPERDTQRHRVFVGGPVAQEQIVLLLRAAQPPTDSAWVFANIFFSASEATLRQLLARTDQEERFQAYMGYAGWGPGQLENELRRGDWHLASPDSRTVFDAEPSEIWHELVRQSAGLWVRRSRELHLSRADP